jgi:uncharacterized protein YjiK
MPISPVLKLVSIIFVLSCAACGSRSGKSFVPQITGYSEKDKQEFIMPDELLEVSGIDYLENDNIAAINDEKGILYFLNLRTDSISSVKFGGKGDYEDVVVTDTACFILDSDGDLFELDPKTEEVAEYKLKVKGKVEFESLVWYRKLNKLVLLTKEQRKKHNAISAYTFNLQTREFDPKPFFHITFKEIFVKLENYNAECKPSAAALSPINNKLYVLASVGKVLLECTPEGVLEKIYKINPTHFPQPEGITFADNGDMYISNEGLEGKGTILKFPYAAVK